jgi:hypothetical protein
VVYLCFIKTPTLLLKEQDDELIGGPSLRSLLDSSPKTKVYAAASTATCQQTAARQFELWSMPIWAVSPIQTLVMATIGPTAHWSHSYTVLSIRHGTAFQRRKLRDDPEEQVLDPEFVVLLHRQEPHLDLKALCES